MNKVFKRILLIIALFGINSWLYANPALDKKPKLYALVIGIGEYPNAHFSSRFAKNDATAIYQKLESQVGDIYTEGSIKLLNQPKQTTEVSIRQAFLDIKPKIKSNDLFVLYIAGKADRIDETYYLLTSQSQDFSAEQLKYTGLSITQLKKWIADIPTTNKLILLDTAMSDSVIKVNDVFAKNISECKTGMILTAGHYTLNKEFRGHSIFTYGVIDALSGIADRNKNGWIESNELAQYVRAIVPAIAKNEFDRRQMPYIDQCGGDLQFKKIPRE
ncbi:caspase family protein [Acinetobacter modestus]|uniref:caspase family protein n=1 Tax=Acinetobacter modestus TaxID=1776740 RepID=UPI00320ACC37